MYGKIVGVPLLAMLCITTASGNTCVPGSDEFRKAEFLGDQAKTLADDRSRLETLHEAIATCNFPHLQYQVGRTLENLGRGEDEQALDAYYRALENNSDANLIGLAYGRRAEIHYRRGDIVKAISEIGLATAHLGANTPAWVRELDLRIDLDPNRQSLSAAQIKSVFNEQESLPHTKSAAEGPNIDFLIHFSTNSDHPTEDSRATLHEVGKALLEFATDTRSEIYVIGHADVRGEEDYNQRLSERRATRVGDWIAHNFKALDGRIKTLGRGETRPKHEGNSDDVHRLNRRVEFVVITR